MSFARNLSRDLVDKRLWPIALLLVIALLAIPVMLGGGGDSAATEADAPLPAATDTTDKVRPVDVSLVGPAAVRSRGGKTLDPFRHPATAKPQGEVQEAARKPAADLGSAVAKPSRSADSDEPTPSSKRRKASSKSDPAPAPVDHNHERTIHTVSLSWGQGEEAKERRVARLTPLGDLSVPAAIFLGVSVRDKEAVFLLGPKSTSNGESECGDPSACRVIRLKAGQAEIVEVAREGADPVQYQLDVGAIDREVLDGSRAAKQAHERVHPDGRKALQGLLQDERTATAMAKFAFDRDIGLVKPAS